METASIDSLNSSSPSCYEGEEVGRAVNVLHHLVLTYFPTPEEKQMARDVVQVLIKAGVRTDAIANSESGLTVEQFLKNSDLID